MLTNVIARAMNIKMLTKDQLLALHCIEKVSPFPLFPYEICLQFNLDSSKKWWGIPENNTQAQEQHIERISSEVYVYLKQNKVHVNLHDTESRENFDWWIHRSNIDFNYRGAKGKTISQQIQDAEKEECPL